LIQRFACLQSLDKCINNMRSAFTSSGSLEEGESLIEMLVYSYWTNVVTTWGQPSADSLKERESLIQSFACLQSLDKCI
jgi:hypothetical protein